MTWIKCHPVARVLAVGVAERLEIVQEGDGWLVSDQRHSPRRYLSSHEAIAMATFEAKRLGANGVDVEVHLWRDGYSEVVFQAGPSSR